MQLSNVLRNIVLFITSCNLVQVETLPVSPARRQRREVKRRHHSTGHLMRKFIEQPSSMWKNVCNHGNGHEVSLTGEVGKPHSTAAVSKSLNRAIADLERSMKRMAKSKYRRTKDPRWRKLLKNIRRDKIRARKQRRLRPKKCQGDKTYRRVDRSLRSAFSRLHWVLQEEVNDRASKKLADSLWEVITDHLADTVCFVRDTFMPEYNFDRSTYKPLHTDFVHKAIQKEQQLLRFRGMTPHVLRYNQLLMVRAELQVAAANIKSCRRG